MAARLTRIGWRSLLCAALLVPLWVLGAVPARAEFLDWSDVTWPAGSLGPRSYTGGDMGTSTVTLTVTDPSGASVAGTPTLISNVSGFDRAHRTNPDWTSSASTQTMRSEFVFGTPVTQLTFAIGDIDTGSATSPFSGWQDIAVVTAFFGATEVGVTVTSVGSAVGIDTGGNVYSTALNATVYGNNAVATTSTAGNATFRVNGPVDRLRIDYYPGNAPDGIPGQGPSNPSSQLLNFHDLVFLAQADLSLTKVASTTTPAVGSTVTYTLTLTNGGPATATGVRVADVLPPGVTYVAGSIAGGTARSAAGAPTLSWDQATLASGASAALTYQATVNAPTGAPNEYRNAAQVTVAPQPDPDSTPNNGTGNGEDDQARVTLTPASAGVAVSGFAYRDDDHDATRDAGEPGTGVALFAKLVPAASPGGPASQVVAVNAATGAYAFAAVAAGSYSIVIDTTNTAADVAPTTPAGFLGTEEADGVRTITVAAAALANLNFGLYRGSRVRGLVFEDDGTGGGIAGNGVRDGAEPGIAGVAVRATAAGCGATCDATTTDGAGAFTLWIPFAANGQVVTVTETNAAGYVSTGGSAGTSGGSYTLATDSVAFNHTSGSDVTGLAFGDLRGSSFAPNHQRTAMPGTAVFYPHVFVAGAAGDVRFSAANVPSPNLPGWAQTIFHDADCSATLDAAEPALAPADAIAVAAAGQVCIILRESVPPGAVLASNDLVTVTADLTTAGGAVAQLTVTDLTTVGLPAGLVLVKSVDKTTAEPGEQLVYTIVYRNDGSAAIGALVISDATPVFTTFVAGSALCAGPLPASLTSCTPTPPAGATGSVSWTLGGSLDPGQSGSVTYTVAID